MLGGHPLAARGHRVRHRPDHCLHCRLPGAEARGVHRVGRQTVQVQRAQVHQLRPHDAAQRHGACRSHQLGQGGAHGPDAGEGTAGDHGAGGGVARAGLGWVLMDGGGRGGGRRSLLRALAGRRSAAGGGGCELQREEHLHIYEAGLASHAGIDITQHDGLTDLGCLQAAAPRGMRGDKINAIEAIHGQTGRTILDCDRPDGFPSLGARTT